MGMVLFFQNGVLDTLSGAVDLWNGAVGLHSCTIDL